MGVILFFFTFEKTNKMRLFRVNSLLFPSRPEKTSFVISSIEDLHLFTFVEWLSEDNHECLHLTTLKNENVKAFIEENRINLEKIVELILPHKNLAILRRNSHLYLELFLKDFRRESCLVSEKILPDDFKQIIFPFQWTMVTSVIGDGVILSKCVFRETNNLHCKNIILTQQKISE